MGRTAQGLPLHVLIRCGHTDIMMDLPVTGSMAGFMPMPEAPHPPAVCSSLLLFCSRVTDARPVPAAPSPSLCRLPNLCQASSALFGDACEPRGRADGLTSHLRQQPSETADDGRAQAGRDWLRCQQGCPAAESNQAPLLASKG